MGGGNLLVGLFGLVVGLVITRLFLRWLLGVSDLEKQVKALGRQVDALRNPGPPPSLSPKEATVIAGAPPLTLRDLAGGLGLLTLTNGRPGLTRLVVALNGQRFEMDDLINEEERMLDLSSAMQAGDRNILMVTGEGAETASAQVRLTAL